MRVLLADDHPAYLRGLAAILGEDPQTEVIGTASDGAAAVQQACELRPDAVVMDLNLPVVDGIEATRQILGSLPGTAVLVLTMHDDDASLQAALAAGARGYLLKESSGPEIVHALAAVGRGEAVFGTAVAGRVLERLAGAVPAIPAALAGLSDREVDVLREICRGAANRDIARRLFLSEKTVRNYVSAILAKLGVADRAAAAGKARAAGLGDGHGPAWRDRAPGG
jgi:DNA-binding NarL/FixJ family response regulator